MSEKERELELDVAVQEQCQLGVDTENRCLILEFSEPIEMFAFDIETAEGFCDALRKGILMIKQLDS